MKISREGIVLIKSFEGFRSRAILRDGGGWVIGYGHTLSAREGASVSEADAELLLRYDLLPVQESVRETIPVILNQHQFDALVSFAFSVGLERFALSDVRERLAAGAPGEAADAMLGWPEPPLPETALRRRAAERALFVADPAGPVALSDLLAAPLPAPTGLEAGPAVTMTESLPPANASPEPSESRREAPWARPDSRSAAVAALLGEPPADDDFETEPAPVIPAFDDQEGPDGTTGATIEETPDAIVVMDPVGGAVEDAVASTSTVLPDPAERAGPERIPEPEAVPFVAQSTADAVALSVARYAPYSAAMVGPLPFLMPAGPRPGSVPPVADAAVIEADTDADITGTETPETTTDQTVEPKGEHSSSPEALPQPQVLERIETGTTEPHTPESGAFESLSDDTRAAPVASEASDGNASLEALVLTPMEEASDPPILRPLWTPEQRAESETGPETGLFGEDLSLTHGGGALLRHEIETEPPVRFDWSETGPFIFMGGVGLVSFGASMAAFRRAAEQSAGDELTIIGWVLALIGLACVGVSSFNLYRRLGLPGGD